MVTSPTASSSDGQKGTRANGQQTMTNGQQQVANGQPVNLGQSFRSLGEVVSGGRSDSGNDRNLNAVIRDVKNVLIVAPPDEIATLLDGSILETLIKATSITTDPSALLDCSDIFDHCLRGIPARQIFPRFVPQFILGLNANSPHVKSKLLQTIRRTIESDAEMLQSIVTPVNSPLLIAVCRCLSDESFDVFGEAKNLLIQVAKHPVGIHALFRIPNSPSLAVIKDILDGDSGKRFRVYELAVDWSKISPDLLTYCDRNALLYALVAELESDDMLLKLNVLEMLTEMAIDAEHCFDWLFQHDVLNEMYRTLTDTRTPPYLFTGVMKFFGHLFKKRPGRCYERFPEFLNAVFRSIANYRSLDIGQRLLAFDTLGVFGSTSEGKLILAEHDREMRESVIRFSQCIREGQIEIRARHLEALSQIFYVKPEEAAPDQFSALLERWFSWLGSSSPMTAMFEILKQPFNEINGPAVELFKNLIVQRWAQRLMVIEAGFLDYLISPLAERQPEKNRRRHELVGLFVHSSSAPEVLQPEDLARLQAFYDRGPQYRPVANFEVAYGP